MVIHTVIASGTAMSAAGTEDTLGGAAFSPAGEMEVQERSKIGGIPKFIGHHGCCNDLAAVGTATGGAYYRIGMNTWETARYIKVPFGIQLNAAAGLGATTGIGAGPQWTWPGIDLDRDGDFEVRTMASATTNSAFAIALYESYGAPVPWAGPTDTWRLVSAAVDGTANTWSPLGNITDLDPRYTYRVNELIGTCENASLLAVRLTSPSNNTYIGALTNQMEAGAINPAGARIVFPHDSITISGVETAVTEQLVDAAQKANIYVGLARIGVAAAPLEPGLVPGIAPGLEELFGGLIGGVGPGPLM